MSTRSANDIALPDRRHFLSTIAGAGALGLPAMPALAAAASRDMELFELVALLTSARARFDVLCERRDEAYDDFQPPQIPEPLFWRKSDFMSVCFDRSRLDSIGSPDDGSERYIYASSGVLQSMMARREKLLAIDALDRPVGADTIARLDEIIEHLEAYEAEEANRLAECGYTAAEQSAEAQSRVVVELKRRIATTPATTTAGLAVKIAAAAFHAPTTHLEQELNALLGVSEPGWQQTERMSIVSAMIDAKKLCVGAPSIDQRAA